MMTKKIWHILFISIMMLTGLSAGVAYSQPGPNYKIKWSVLDGGGGPSRSGSYTVSSSIGQPSVIDYMGMLHQLRWLPAESGQWFEFPIFTGKRQITYRAKVERERLVRRGWDRDSLHLRLYEYNPKKNKLEDEVELRVAPHVVREEERRVHAPQEDVQPASSPGHVLQGEVGVGAGPVPHHHEPPHDR